jgi:O-antigen ligase
MPKPAQPERSAAHWVMLALAAGAAAAAVVALALLALTLAAAAAIVVGAAVGLKLLTRKPRIEERYGWEAEATQTQ